MRDFIEMVADGESSELHETFFPKKDAPPPAPEHPTEETVSTLQQELQGDEVWNLLLSRADELALLAHELPVGDVDLKCHKKIDFLFSQVLALMNELAYTFKTDERTLNQVLLRHLKPNT
jgi:hypothetical protein